MSEKGRTPPEVGPAPSENGPQREAGQSHREKMQLLISAFSNEQQDQYEIFRRSTFPKSSVRRLMQGLCSTNVPQNAVIAMAGITKVYVGEVVESACQVGHIPRREAVCLVPRSSALIIIRRTRSLVPRPSHHSLRDNSWSGKAWVRG